MKYLNISIIYLTINTIILLTGCKTNKQVPNAIYENNYSALTSSDLNTISKTTKKLSKEQAINIALENNPGYKSSQYKADAARAEYYKELSSLSPTAAVGAGIGNNRSGAGISANYQISPNKLTNTLAAKSKAKEVQLQSENYKRKLVQKVTEENNQLQKNKMTINIYKDDERFQEEMLQETINKYKAGKASKADVLNFEIQALKAMDKSVQANRDYKTNSYKLASTMGITSARLPKNVETKSTTINNSTEKLHDIDYYLNLAIDNRPDLKAQRAALQASRYELLSAAAKLSPDINLGTNNRGLYANAKMNIQGGSKVANIYSESNRKDIQEEELYKKWLEVVSKVKTQYAKLISAQKQKAILLQTIQKAKQRRNLIQQKYNDNKVDLAELNQAQNNYINSLNSYKKAEIDIADAQAGLNSACGI